MNFLPEILFCSSLNESIFFLNLFFELNLLDTKICLPDNISPFVKYRSLKRVTHNFKRDATRINCTKLKYLYTDDGLQFPKHFKDYFPRVDTDVL
jgi:hypothetical protein